MTKKPLVSVITVVFNGEKTINSCLESVRSQDYINIEHIIIDGGSSDGTLKCIEKYMLDIAVLISEEDGGIYHAMNKGIALSSGEIICILNSDDLYKSHDVISKAVSVLVCDDQCDAVLTDVVFVPVDDINSKSSRKIKAHWFKPYRLRFGWMPPHPGMFLRRDVHEKYGEYKLDYKIAADYEFMVRIFLANRVSYKILSMTSVVMREGGVSTKNRLSTKIISNEIVKSCLDNDIYTNMFLVILRIPIKMILKWVIRP